jgi:hypothetical protein
MKITDYKKGDIYPSNKGIRQHFFDLGERFERELDKSLLSNENVEIKTQGLQTTTKWGNVFVEYAAVFPGSTEVKPSGLSITECDTWVFQFYDEDTNKLLPFSINLNRQYLLEVIDRGLEQGWVKEQITPCLETGDYNYGYLVPIIFLLQPIIQNTFEPVMEKFNDLKLKKIDWSDEKIRNLRLAELNLNRQKK